jgi:hypothetical protein
MSPRFFVLLALLATVTILLPACSGSSERDSDARFRTLQISPDAPDLEVVVDGKVRFPSLGYAEGTAYVKIGTGLRTFQVNEAASGSRALEFVRSIAKNSKQTLFIVNNYGSVQELVLLDDTDRPAAGQLKIRVVHGSPSAPVVDVYLTEPGESLEGIDPALSNIPFLGYTGYSEIPAGDYRIAVTDFGTKNILYDSGAVGLTAGSILTVAAIELDTPISTLQLSILTDDANAPVLEIPDARSRLRALHASPDAPNVDVLIDDVVSVTDLAFKEASDYLTVAAAQYGVKVNETGTASTVIDGTVDLMLQTDYTLLAVGYLADIEPLLLMDDNSSPERGKSRVRFVHVAPTAGLVDVYVTIPNVTIDRKQPTFPGLDFKDGTEYIELDSGDYQFRATAAGTKDVLINLGTVRLADGTVNSALAFDDPGTSSGYSIRIYVDQE